MAAFCGDCLGIGEVIRVEGPAEAFPVSVQNEKELVSSEGAVACAGCPAVASDDGPGGNG